MPGYQNSGPGHWQTLWEERHPEFRRVRQRDWEHPHRDEWVGALDEAARAEPGPVVLVAHSLGCLAAVHWAGVRSRAVAGALLVAPPDVEDDWAALVKDFAPIPTAPLPFPSIVVTSTDDPYAEIARTQFWARAWGSRLDDLGDVGHLNPASGFGAWPQAEQYIGELSAAAAGMRAA